MLVYAITVSVSRCENQRVIRFRDQRGRPCGEATVPIEDYDRLMSELAVLLADGHGKKFRADSEMDYYGALCAEVRSGVLNRSVSHLGISSRHWVALSQRISEKYGRASSFMAVGAQQCDGDRVPPSPSDSGARAREIRAAEEASGEIAKGFGRSRTALQSDRACRAHRLLDVDGSHGKWRSLENLGASVRFISRVLLGRGRISLPSPSAPPSAPSSQEWNVEV